MCAAKLGPLHAAANKPVILLQGGSALIRTESVGSAPHPHRHSQLLWICRCSGWHTCLKLLCLLRQSRASCKASKVSGLLNGDGTGAGVNHAQFGDDARNAPRGDIVATVSYEEARAMIAQASKSLLLAQLLIGSVSVKF